MIAIDTSALVAILMRESDAMEYALAIQDDEEPMASAASLVELYLVMKHKQGAATVALIDELIASASITIVSVTPNQAKIACEASYKFPSLNYGDTFSYALALDRNVPLLFKGNNFTETDIKIAKC